MELLIAIMILAIVSIIAFWRPLAPIFMIITGMSLMIGLEWYDTYTNELGLAISLVLIGYSLLCVGYTYKIIFGTGETK